MKDANSRKIHDDFAATDDREPSDVLKSSSETRLTYQLKWAAWKWLYMEAGCRSIGMEVKLEGPFGRVVDLVGVGKGNVVYIVEVKSSRGRSPS